MKRLIPGGSFFILAVVILVSCRGKDAVPSKEDINEINLKRGPVISCGSTDKQFGSVEFETSCSGKEKSQFDLAIELLHSFEYDEAEKVFSKIIDEEPGCAMAYWGVAMCNYHPLWTAPLEPELRKGAKAIEIAKKIPQKTKREAGYIDAISLIYKDWDKVALPIRCLAFEKAMEKLYTDYPGDKEAAIFYALALDAAADPSDKSFANQKKAGSILMGLYPNEPNHPGVAHYIIHTYDYPGLAELALPAARKYAAVAPSSSHALHMPSHIFTRLGYWDECIQSNLASIAAAQCYAETSGLKGHWDEELHGLDYLVYAYLQKGENDLARKQCAYLQTIQEVNPVNFKVAYSYAAIPARYVLENKMWKEAAALTIYPMKFPWEKFPWQKAINCFARVLGAVNTGNLDLAHSDVKELRLLYDTLMGEKDIYKANQVQIQIHASEAWIAFKEGKNADALKLMNLAADMEDRTEKHPVTPGEVIPARELLGDMLLKMSMPDKALEAYTAELEKHPNRFNGLYGAGLAAEKAGNPEKAGFYYRQLLAIVSPTATRPELTRLRLKY
jgi:tetratricopeptide (TPR) repeat protein